MERCISILLLLGACAHNAKSEMTASCDLISAEPLTSTPEEEWPEGLSASIDAYEGFEGAWTVDVVCPDEEASTVTVQLTPSARSDIGFRQFQGETCDGVDSVAITETSVTFTGWTEGSIDSSLETALGFDSVDVRIEGGTGPSILIQSTSGGELTGTAPFRQAARARA